MKKPKGLIQRGGTYYLKARVPSDLIGAFGKEQWYYSLKTRDYSEAVKRLNLERVKIDTAIDSKRKKLDATTFSSPLNILEFDEYHLQRMVLIWFHQLEEKTSYEDQKFLDDDDPKRRSVAEV
ncbi:MAG: hypothetical protein MI748_12300, partial [Opitutales bacterium]|nr:hypothetical protein [Opitutales bacterium]